MNNEDFERLATRIILSDIPKVYENGLTFNLRNNNNNSYKRLYAMEVHKVQVNRGFFLDFILKPKYEYRVKFFQERRVQRRQEFGHFVGMSWDGRELTSTAPSRESSFDYEKEHHPCYSFTLKGVDEKLYNQCIQNFKDNKHKKEVNNFKRILLDETRYYNDGTSGVG